MSFGSWVDQRIANVLTILGVEKRLDALHADAKQELDELRVQAFEELAQTRDKAFAELEETRDKALQVFADEMPKAAGAVSREAVTAVFEHTQIDETTNRVTGVFNGIFDRLGIPR